MEAIAAVSLASNICQFMEFGAKVVARLQEFEQGRGELPKAFQDIGVWLPLLIDCLNRCEV